MNNIFVVGTDTGVGKSVLSLLLMQFFFNKGMAPCYLKPVQTGCRDPYDTDSDAKFIYENTYELKGKDPADSIIYCFIQPKAPFFAARNEKTEIDLTIIREVLTSKSSIYNPVIIEAAGGLLVPFNKDALMVDAVKSLEVRPLLASRAGLGTINHTLMSLEILERREIKPLGIILLDSGEQPVPLDMINENIEAIETNSGVKVAGVVGRIRDFSKPGEQAFLPIENVFSEAFKFDGLFTSPSSINP